MIIRQSVYSQSSQGKWVNWKRTAPYENKIPFFPGCICNKWQNMMLQISQAHSHGKYDNNGWGWYFWFDDDNDMSYRYILSITSTEIGQLYTYKPIWQWKVIDRTGSMLDKPPQDKLYKHLDVFNAHEQSCIMMIKCLKQNTTWRPKCILPMTHPINYAI